MKKKLVTYNPLLIPILVILQNQTKIKISLNKIRKIVFQIFEILSISNADLDISFVGDLAIQKLNRRFRKKDKSTDVLSFPLYEAKEARKGNLFLGDLVISLPTTQKQAKEYRKTFHEELYFLIVHGVLHLLGYDHEKSDRAAKKMRSLEKKILKNIL